MARSKLHRRYVKQARSNPPLFTEVLEFAVPGFGGFAATRFLTRIAATQVAQRAPSWGKHAGALASVAAFLSAWFLANRVKFLEKYHTPLVVGAGIATAQSLIQLYLPWLGWMVSDATPDIASATQGLSVADQQLVQHQLAATDEDPNEFTYNDAFDAGRYSGPTGARTMKTGGGSMQPNAPTAPPPQAPHDDASDLAIDDAIGVANMGVFAN